MRRPLIAISDRHFGRRRLRIGVRSSASCPLIVPSRSRPLIGLATSVDPRAPGACGAAISRPFETQKGRDRAGVLRAFCLAAGRDFATSAPRVTPTRRRTAQRGRLDGLQAVGDGMHRGPHSPRRVAASGSWEGSAAGTRSASDRTVAPAETRVVPGRTRAVPGA